MASHVESLPISEPNQTNHKRTHRKGNARLGCGFATSNPTGMITSAVQFQTARQQDLPEALGDDFFEQWTKVSPQLAENGWVGLGH